MAPDIHPSNNQGMTMEHYCAALAAQWLDPYTDCQDVLGELISGPSGKRTRDIRALVRERLRAAQESIDAVSFAAIHHQLQQSENLRGQSG